MLASALEGTRKTLPPMLASDGVEIEVREGLGPPPPPTVLLQWSLWLVVDGHADVRIGGLRRELKAGSVAIARPGDVVSVARRHSDRMREVHVTFWPEALRGLVPFVAPMESVTLEPKLTTRVTDLLRVLGANGLGRLEAQRLLGSIALSLEPSRVRIAPSVEAARALLDRDYTHDHKLEDLARVAGVSKYHLIRAFHGDLGVTPHAYLTAVRVAHAREMLRAGEKIPAVARELGFATASHLAKNFRRSFGMRPSHYARAAHHEELVPNLDARKQRRYQADVAQVTAAKRA